MTSNQNKMKCQTKENHFGMLCWKKMGGRFSGQNISSSRQGENPPILEDFGPES